MNKNLGKILQKPALSARGKSRTYSDENLQAISFPVGGIGSGLIQINGKAERHIWQISNSFCQAHVPNSFFAVRAQKKNDQPIIKTLQTSDFGPFEKMDKLTFRGEYPFGWFDFRDKKLPLEITLETFNPLIPLNEKDSAIPCAIHNITAKNISSQPLEVSFLATQQNTVGFEEVAHPNNPPTGTMFADFKKVNTEWKPERDEFKEQGETKVVQKKVSAEFEIKHRYIHLLIGGSRQPDKACINLIVDSEKKITATAKDKPVYEWYVWDLAEFQNKQAFFEILNRPENKSEHITIDRIFFSDDEMGMGSFTGFGQNKNAILKQDNTTILHMTSEKPGTTAGFGDMSLIAFEPNAQAIASWESLEELKQTWLEQNFLQGPEQAGPTPQNQTLNAALAIPFKLQPNQQRTITFILTWYFPNVVHGTDRGADNKPLPKEAHWLHKGNMYTNFWSSALDTAKYLIEKIDELTAQTRLYHNSLYSSNLPHWLLDRISSQVVVIRSATCFWSRDGYFGGWEGCDINSGSCYGNCSHVWHYAQSHARLFPEIARKMREQSFKYQANDGAFQFRQPLSKAANDGQCGEILEAYREHLTNTDQKWLDKYWPKIKKAMNYVINQWDSDEDGILAGSQHNTLDVDLGGSTSWIGTLYLAALDACKAMAKLQGDNATAQRYNNIRKAGMKNQNETLWNGEFYIQIPDEQARRDYNNGCHIDQILGEWWAQQLNLEPAYPKDRKISAMNAVIKYNFRTNFNNFEQKPRKYVVDEDAGTLMITWPHNDRPENHILYADEVWSGTEYSLAATMIQLRMLKEGQVILKAVSDRYDGRLRTGLAGAEDGTQAWGYSGNPFCDEECGKFYVRPMSIFSVLLSCQGFIYNGPAGKIGFKPVWQPENHITFFTAAQGWGLFTQKQTKNQQTEQIEIKYGRLDVKQLIFELAPKTKPEDITVTLNNEKIETTFELDRNQITIELKKEVTIDTDQTLEIEFNLKK